MLSVSGASDAPSLILQEGEAKLSREFSKDTAAAQSKDRILSTGGNAQELCSCYLLL